MEQLRSPEIPGRDVPDDLPDEGQEDGSGGPGSADKSRGWWQHPSDAAPHTGRGQR